MSKIITEEMIAELREAVRPYLTEKRYGHTLAVEEEAAELGKIFLPDEVPYLRAAALLHDITKKLSAEKQLQLYEKFGIMNGKEDLQAPKLFHAKTAAALICDEFADFAEERVVGGVRWHTTGHRGMSIFEALIYLADYIEKTRTFVDCIKLRALFWNGIKDAKSENEKLSVLYKTMVTSFDMTMKCLMEEGALIDRDTVEARNYYLLLLTAKTSEDAK